MRINKNRVFWRSAARDFKRTGAVAPSSRFLGQCMTSMMAGREQRSIRVLEVGGGTGSVTAVIARYLKSGDHLDVYEIDGSFFALLRWRIKHEEVFQKSSAGIEVHNEPIETIDRNMRYDFVISCLPFTNFRPEIVREIFEIYREILNPGGTCSFFEYLLLREAGQIVRGPAERRRVAAVAEVVRSYVDRYGCKNHVVFRNLPPALIRHLRFNGA